MEKIRHQNKKNNMKKIKLEKNAAWKKCNNQRMQHETSGKKGNNIKGVQYEKSGIWKWSNMKKVQHWKVHHEKNAAS